MNKITLVWMDKIREMINQNYDDKKILNVLNQFGESEEKRISENVYTNQAIPEKIVCDFGKEENEKQLNLAKELDSVYYSLTKIAELCKKYDADSEKDLQGLHVFRFICINLDVDCEKWITEKEEYTLQWKKSRSSV